MKRYMPFYLFSIGFFLLITIPNLFSNGMFMDGLFYAVISRNLAAGVGSLWHLHFSNTLFNIFYEHPPLSFWLEGIFFRVFGDHLFVERLYSLLTYFVTSYILVLLWKQIIPSKAKASATGWFPLLLWSLVPLVTWGYANNMIENTMVIFTMLSLFFIVKQVQSRNILWTVLAGLSLSAALLTKGLVGLFPWSAYFFIFIFTKEINLKEMIVYSFVLALFTILPLLYIYFFIPEGFQTLLIYFNHQIVHSVAHVQTVNSRFYILKRMLTELSLDLVIIAGIFLIGKRKKMNHKRSGLASWGKVFLAIGLSGVIPIMISLKQRGFYILPVFPVFAAAFSLFSYQIIYNAVRKFSAYKIKYRIFTGISICIFILSLVFIPVFYKKTGRDKALIHNVYSIIRHVPKDTVICGPSYLCSVWSLHGYLARFANISLLCHINNNCQYCLIKKGSKTPKGYTVVPMETKYYSLLIRQK